MPGMPAPMIGIPVTTLTIMLTAMVASTMIALATGIMVTITIMQAHTSPIPPLPTRPVSAREA
jgi:hypothetical protein